jgi:hypothetical protein
MFKLSRCSQYFPRNVNIFPNSRPNLLLVIFDHFFILKRNFRPFSQQKAEVSTKTPWLQKLGNIWPKKQDIEVPIIYNSFKYYQKNPEIFEDSKVGAWRVISEAKPEAKLLTISLSLKFDRNFSLTK